MKIDFLKYKILKNLVEIEVETATAEDDNDDANEQKGNSIDKNKKQSDNNDL